MILIRCYGDYTSWFPWKETLAVCVRACACDVWITCSILFNLTHRSSKTSHLGFFDKMWNAASPSDTLAYQIVSDTIELCMVLCSRQKRSLRAMEYFVLTGLNTFCFPKWMLTPRSQKRYIFRAQYSMPFLLRKFFSIAMLFVTRAFNSRWVSDLEQIFCGQVSCLVDSLLCVVYLNSRFVHCGFCSVDKNMSNYTHNTCLPPTSLSLTLSFALIHSQSITYPFSVTNCIFIDRDSLMSPYMHYWRECSSSNAVSSTPSMISATNNKRVCTLESPS